MNVFKAGRGTVTVWESSGGQKGAQLYKLSGIPLTPSAPIQPASRHQRLVLDDIQCVYVLCVCVRTQ